MYGAILVAAPQKIGPTPPIRYFTTISGKVDTKCAGSWETILSGNERSIRSHREKTTLNYLETWCGKWKRDSEREPKNDELSKIGNIREIVSHETSIIRPILPSWSKVVTHWRTRFLGNVLSWVSTDISPSYRNFYYADGIA